MFKQLFYFELDKLFIKRNVYIFFSIFLLVIAFNWEGINDYKTILESQKPFSEIEKAKVTQYLNYTQYGTRGLRLLFIPSPLSVIFNDLAVFHGLASNIDTGEGLYIYNSFKGKDIFDESGGYMDFSGMMLLISCFLALLYGYDVTKSRGYLKLLFDLSKYRHIPFITVLVRIILLNLAFMLISLMCFSWLLINGINAGVFFLYYILDLILLITFFVAAGALIGHLKRKSTGLILMAVFYFSLVFSIPWLTQKLFYIEATNNIQSEYEMEYEKLKVLMEYERRFYERFGVWKSGKVAPDEIKAMVESGQQIEFKKLREYENNRRDAISKRVKVYQFVSAFFPTTYYLSVNRELSGKGFQSLDQFYLYALEMKYGFIRFYIQKKHYIPLPEKGVESFIKGNENLFHGESQLPSNFWQGFLLTLFYIGVMLVKLYKFTVETPEPAKVEIKKPQINLKDGYKPTFILCGNDQVRDDIFNYYQHQENAVCLNKIDTSDFNSYFDLKPVKVFSHLVKIAGVDEIKAVENLELLGVEIKSLKTLSHENIVKIYTAVMTSFEYDYIVINDIIKGESGDFEKSFFNLLLNRGEQIIYLSCDMFNQRVSIVDFLNVDTSKTFDIPLPLESSITLR